MREIILEKLKIIENEFDVKVLYACESGSRAWGFASSDSDFDVRFIYVHRMEHYLSVNEQRDVIEVPINDVLDVCGWELRKALRLFRKSNATLYEWLQSPIVYIESEVFVGELTSLIPDYFSARAAMHHYLSMARGVFENELSSEKVKLKKYFYALRPALAARWIADMKSVPPMDLPSLRKMLPEYLDDAIDKLLGVKATVDESFVIDRNEEINRFISESIEYATMRVPVAPGRSDEMKLNSLFRRHVL